MTKVKSPLLSLGAKGTLGDELTFRESRGVSIAEKTPIPAYRRTLPQMYQRWTYQDYAWLWGVLDPATKQVFASAGSRYHLTGFQYWMKTRLENLTHMGGWWKLDDAHLVAIADSSRNNNTGVNVGCVAAGGLIGGAAEFDGVNDYIDLGTSASIQFATVMTLHLFLRLTPFSGSSGFIVTNRWNDGFGNQGYVFFRQGGANNVQFIRYLDGVNLSIAGAFTPGVWHHWAMAKTSTHMHLYRDGLPAAAPVADARTIKTQGHIYLGTAIPGFTPLMTMDNAYLLGYWAFPAEVARWAERRYP